MIYLDTSCFVKLYYPEPDSAQVAALIAGQALCYSPLHALEFTNALHLRIFRGQATLVQAQAALALVETDLKTGVLLSPPFEWSRLLEEAIQLSQQNTGQIGCRSLDILHCALARALSASQFVTADTRQRKLALAMGLNVAAI